MPPAATAIATRTDTPSKKLKMPSAKFTASLARSRIASASVRDTSWPGSSVTRRSSRQAMNSASTASATAITMRKNSACCQRRLRPPDDEDTAALLGWWIVN